MTSDVFTGNAPPLVYSEVMEDGDVVASALATQPSDTVVVVASAGDNVFHAALAPSVRVLGVDINPTQVAFCRLKAHAVRELEWSDFAALVGVVEVPGERRRALLHALSPELVEGALPDGEALAAALEHGLASAGKLAAFVAPLRQALQELVGRETLERIVREPDREARRQLWRERFDHPGLDDLLASALNESTISNAFIPAWAFGRMAEPRFDRHYKRVLARLFVELEPASNPYLQRLWLGRYLGPESAQRYLQAAAYPALREAVARIEWHTADLVGFLSTLPARSVHAFNLSNILDWGDDAQHDRTWLELERVAADGARVFLRSFLAERAPPQRIRDGWRTEPARSESMRVADRVGYFSRYELWTRRA